MRSLTKLCLCVILLSGAFTLPAQAQVPASGAPAAAPSTAPSTRPWSLGGRGAEPIIRPATAPSRAELTLKYDTTLANLVITVTNRSREAIIVDRELVIPLYFTFFNNREQPVRLDTPDGNDPQPGDFAQRLVKVEPGQSIERTVDLSKPFATWMSGSVSTFINEERKMVPFGREKFRAVAPDGRVKRIQVVYAILPADLEAIPQYTGIAGEDLKLFIGPLTAEISLPDEP